MERRGGGLMNYKQGMELLAQLERNTDTLGKVVPQNQAQIVLVRDLVASNIVLKTVMLDTIKPDVYTITVQDCYHDTDRDNYPRDKVNEVDEYEDSTAEGLIDHLVNLVIARFVGKELSEARYKATSQDGYHHWDYPFHAYSTMRCNGEVVMHPDEVWDKVKAHPKYVECLAAQVNLAKAAAQCRAERARKDKLEEFKRLEANLKEEGILP
jgi:hypothetical protein